MISNDATLRICPTLSSNQGKGDRGNRNMLILLYLLCSILRSVINKDFDKKDHVNKNGNAT